MCIAEAIYRCKVRGYIARVSKPTEKYWKNVPQKFSERVSHDDWHAMDWEVFDPEADDCPILGG